jgi:tight adherence protein C
MPVSLIPGVNVAADLTMLMAALMLTVGGLALIASGYRTRDQLLARRIELAKLGIAIEAAESDAAPATRNPFRIPVRGMGEASQREVIRRFAKLGVGAHRALGFFVAVRLAVAAGLGGIAFLWIGRSGIAAAQPVLPMATMAMAAIIGWFLPMMFIAHSVRRRTKEIRSGLPDALELLVVCVEAGLSLEDGLGRVVNELRRSQPALADELDLTLADLKILPNRDQALANLAARVDVPSVRSVVTTLAQTLRYGTPLAQSLRVVAAEMRNDYLIELEERANRLPAYLTLPVILFMMPTIFLIVGGPAALRLLDALLR